MDVTLDGLDAALTATADGRRFLGLAPVNEAPVACADPERIAAHRARTAARRVSMHARGVPAAGALTPADA